LKIGLKPNVVTIFGLIGHIIAAFLLVRGQMSWAGIVLIIFAPLDALDGAMARISGNPSRFGAFLDSVVDRYAEFVLYGGLLLFFYSRADILGTSLVYLSVMGSIMVSYARARAESLNLTAKIGLLSRLERYLILVPALVFRFPIVGLWILAIFTNVTALQRVFSVKRQVVNKGGSSGSLRS
jgi:CDP-diacylglycerol--glycerol-3-phosphate 3-phosphatidyltransferase